MKFVALLLLIISVAPGAPKALRLLDETGEKLAPGWAWVRENPDGWRIRDGALELLVEPGNMWGGGNDAKNLLVRPLPEVSELDLVVAGATVANTPTHQFEQVNLVWYYDDSNMVKIGLELVDGKVSLVMGREEKDKTQTLCKTPLAGTEVQVRLSVRSDALEGHYRASDTETWQMAGQCELPVNGEPKISLQAYQGPEDKEHWGRISKFKLETFRLVE